MLSARFQNRVDANLRYWHQKVNSAAPAQQKQLGAEHNNLQLALEFGLHIPATKKNAIQLALSLFPLLDGETTDPIWFKIYGKAIMATREKEIKARLLNQLGYLYSQARKGKEALESHERAEAIARQNRSRIAIARSLVGKSQSLWVLDRSSDSLTYAELALIEFAGQENSKVPQQDLALAQNVMGLALHSQGKYQEAQKHFRKASSQMHRSGNKFLHARIHNNRAFSLMEEGLLNIEKSPEKSRRKLAQAVGFFSKAISIYKELGKPKQLARVELSRCNLYIRLGKYNEAEEALGQLNSKISLWVADFDLQAQIAYSRGLLTFQNGDWIEAEIYFQNALYIWEQTGHQLLQAQMLIHLVELYNKLDRQSEGNLALRKAQDLLDALPSRPIRDKLLLELIQK